MTKAVLVFDLMLWAQLLIVAVHAVAMPDEEILAMWRKKWPADLRKERLVSVAIAVLALLNIAAVWVLWP